MNSAAILGAGLAGRLLALELLERGWRVTLSDPDTSRGRKSCAWTGAGMLAPFCELESAEAIVSELGAASLLRWPAVLERLERAVLFEQRGSLVVAHESDMAELQRLRRRVEECAPDDARMECVDRQRLLELEPQLAGFPGGLFFPREGHIDNRDLMQATTAALEAHASLTWIHEPPGDGFDATADCRGMGANADDPELRGVRGELLHVRAPEVNLNRPVRLMHPRYPLYIVPRADHLFVIGASQVESEDRRGITVRSALELLSAAYSLHTGFAEAELVETCVDCRPAYPDNLPRLTPGENRVAVNGLYRHGFLLGPVLAAAAADYLETGSVPAAVQPLVHGVA